MTYFTAIFGLDRLVKTSFFQKSRCLISALMKFAMILNLMIICVNITMNLGLRPALDVCNRDLCLNLSMKFGSGNFPIIIQSPPSLPLTLTLDRGISSNPILKQKPGWHQNTYGRIRDLETGYRCSKICSYQTFWDQRFLFGRISQPRKIPNPKNPGDEKS